MGLRSNVGPETQRPCARLRDADHKMRSASGDPAMVFIFRMASIPSVVRASCPAQRPDCCWTSVLEHDLFGKPVAGCPDRALAHDRLRESESGFQKIMRKRAQDCARELGSTTNVVLFEQRLVARLVLALDVIMQGTARGDHFQEAPA